MKIFIEYRVYSVFTFCRFPIVLWVPKVLFYMCLDRFGMSFKQIDFPLPCCRIDTTTSDNSCYESQGGYSQTGVQLYMRISISVQTLICKMIAAVHVSTCVSQGFVVDYSIIAWCGIACVRQLSRHPF